jgi:hypothetical protein
VTNLEVTSPPSRQSGTQVTVNWNDADIGNLAASGWWTDLAEPSPVGICAIGVGNLDFDGFPAI